MKNYERYPVGYCQSRLQKTVIRASFIHRGYRIMNVNKNIKSQARMNVEEIQSVIDAVKFGTVSITGLLVIREDIGRMVLLYADEIQHGDNQAEILACKAHINSIVTELSSLNEIIITMTKGVTDVDKEKIIDNLKRLKKLLLRLIDIDR